MENKSKIKNPLFAATSGHGNVVLNFRNSPKTEFGPYANAFHEAGKTLAERLSARAGYSDLEACPIVFLYRHAMELHIKAIIVTGNDILELSGQVPIIKTEDLGSHRIHALVPALKQIFVFLGWAWDFEISGMSNPEDFEQLLQYIEELDPLSYSFRYPTTKKGKPTLPAHFTFNILEFSRQLDPILDLLDGADSGIKEEWDTRAEAAFEAQHTLL